MADYDTIKSEILATVHAFVEGRLRDIAGAASANHAINDSIHARVSDLESRVEKMGGLDADIASLIKQASLPVTNVSAACRRHIVDQALAATGEYVNTVVADMRESIAPVNDIVRDAKREMKTECADLIDYTVETRVMPRVRAIVDAGRSECIAACVNSEVVSMNSRIAYSRIDDGPVLDGQTLVVPCVRLKGWGECELLSAGDGVIIDSPAGRVMSAVAESRNGTSLRVPGAMTATPEGTTIPQGLATPVVVADGLAVRDRVYVGSVKTVVTDRDGAATDATTPVRAIDRVGPAGIGNRIGIPESRVALMEPVAGIERDGTVFGSRVETDVLVTKRIAGDVAMDSVTARKVNTGSLSVTSDGFVMPIHESFPEKAPDGSVILTRAGMFVNLAGTWRPVA